jgi:two-component system, NtrC family, response regulator
MSGSQARILVIDDDENIRKVVCAILKDKGYEVDQAGSGGEAIAKTGQNHYDLMLVDIRLPDMEGTELLARIHETIPRIRKIMVTGYPTLQNAVSAVNQGADAYIMKPFDVEKMLCTIEEQLEKQKLDRKFSEDRVAAFIETRVKELEAHESKTNELC